MAKYDFDFKLSVVKEYLDGEGGFKYLAKKWGLPSHTPLREWVLTYKQVGEEGLRRRKSNKTYSLNFKLDVIKYYQNSGESYLDVAIKYNLSSQGQIKKWHETFLKHGIEALSKKVGRPTMPKNTNKLNKQKELTREQKLERENELLRAELAFIKKLRASGRNIPSRLLKQKPESSENSGKTSD